MSELLRVENVSKAFVAGPTPVRALDRIDFSVADGEFVCLLGASGSGKSTLLRIIGGLLRPDSGTVWLQGLPSHTPQREIGFLFQKSNLMPWRTTLENVLLPAEVQHARIDETMRAQARQMLRTVGLAGFEAAYPHQLSGGMSQRVALARVLLQQPKLLLLDEPFGALDALTRERLNLELLRIHNSQLLTTIMVTHDINEAVLLADRVLILSERPGRILTEIPVDLPRPRQIDQLASPRFGEYALTIRRQIGGAATVV